MTGFDALDRKERWNNKGKNGPQQQTNKRMAQQRRIIQSNSGTGWFVLDDDDGHQRSMPCHDSGCVNAFTQTPTKKLDTKD